MANEQGDSSNVNQTNFLINNEQAAASIKLPPFWVSRPEVWFSQIEAQFAIAGIVNDKTKYNYIISALPIEIISNVFDIVENPPADNLYQNIKSNIIGRLSSSEEKRLDNLLSGSEIGDKKPSDFYREMSSSIGGSALVGQDFLAKLWKRKLPKTIQISLTASGKTQLNEVLDLADKIWEAYQSSNICAYSSNKYNNSFNPASKLIDNSTEMHNELLKSFSKLSNKLSETLDAISQKNQSFEFQLNSLKSQINDIRTPSSSYCSCGNFNERNRGRSSSRGKMNSNENNLPLCYYHYRFQDKARKCLGPWCSLYESFNLQNSKN